MKIFITGATGFIGRYVLNYAIEKSYDLVVLRRKKPRYENYDLKNKIKWIYKSVDLIKPSDLEGVDVLIHMAAAGVSPKVASSKNLYYINVYSTLKIMDSARLAGVKKTIITGSYAEYGITANHYKFIPAKAPLQPITPYAASKAAAYCIATAYALEHNMNLSYLRIFSAYGDGQYKNNFWPLLKKSALSGKDFKMTSGDQIRDFIYVGNVAEEILKIVESSFLESKRVSIQNIGSGNPMSIASFAEIWWNRFEAKGDLVKGVIPYRENEIMRYAPQLKTDFLN